MAEVFKKIEIVGTSSNSVDEAISNAIEKAAQTVHGLSWFEVAEIRGSIADGKVRQFQAAVKIGFKID
jgi:flavin-binding protein dodecin